MLPDPLHPAIVHFPIVLAVLLPIFALGALWTIRKGTAARRAWGVPLALSAALSLSSYVAVQTGETQDERVESVVSAQPLETHEDAAELFLTLTGVLVVVAVAGLMPGFAGRSARILATGGAVALVGVALNVGHSGGELVYRHGAASAYTDSVATGANVSVADADTTAAVISPSDGLLRPQ